VRSEAIRHEFLPQYVIFLHQKERILIDALTGNEVQSYKVSEACKLLVYNYNEYALSAPIDVDAEIERFPEAGLRLVCAIMTMLHREDHFSNGSYYRRFENGQVAQALERIYELLISGGEQRE
jgi:hypothetical protein